MKSSTCHSNRRLKKSTSLPILLFSTVLFAMAGCASLTPEQCKNANWRQIGFNDGAEGNPLARLDDHAKACAEYGVRPNLDEYLSGRSQGLLNYCQAENGYVLGRRGAGHIVADCPENLKPAFLEQYDRGSQIHALEEEIGSYRYRIDSNQREIRRNNERIGAIRAELQKTDLPAERRTALLNEYDRLVNQKDVLVRNMSALQRDIDRVEYRLRMRTIEFGR